ncbi:Deoxyuridine 5'-triphosphate nucleotidohydrolase [compost metagenome]
MKLLTKLLYDGAKLPERGHDIDVGLDLFCPKAGVLYPGPNKIPLGISIEVPIGYSAEVRPRTGMASGEKTREFTVYNVHRKLVAEEKVYVGELKSRGIALIAQSPPIDPGYTGEINAIVLNTSELTIEYPAGTRFGQLVVYPITYAIPTESVDTSRGDKGFGSTGA